MTPNNTPNAKARRIASAPLGVLFGVIAALYHNKWQDYTVAILTIFGISVPSFIMAAVLQYVFSMKLGLFPVAGWDEASAIEGKKVYAQESHPATGNSPSFMENTYCRTAAMIKLGTEIPNIVKIATV